MAVIALLCFLFPATLYAASDVGYFSAIARVEKLLVAERKMVGRVKQYIDQGGQVTGDLRRYVDTYEDKLLHPPRDDPMHYAHHPTGAYLLIKRLSQEHTYDIFEHAQQLIDKPNIMVQLPDDNDLEMSALALVRLQDVYALDINSLVHGQIVMSSRQVGGPQLIAVTTRDPILTLDLSDTLFIGDAAYRQEDYNNAIVWYSFTLAQLGTVTGKPGRADVLSKLAGARSKLRQHQHALALYRDALQLEPDNQIILAEADEAKRLANVQDSDPVGDEEPPDRKAWRLKSEHLCSLDVLKNQAPRRGLKCRYDRSSPHLYIRPSKMEVLHRRNPRLVMYHDAVNDNEARTFRDMAFPKFQRSMVLNAEGYAHIDIFSVSERGVLKDEDDDFTARMSRRVDHITGLSTALPHGEDFLVMNYGLGGAIQQHLDYFSEGYLNHAAIHGNRMVTTIFYLSDVEAGGAIVFPEINLITPVVKNAALTIQNIKKSGAFVPRSMHAGCPVLIGSKWTAVKWIREFGNEFRRPCGLKPYE